jgi:hypothetical protein
MCDFFVYFKKKQYLCGVNHKTFCGDENPIDTVTLIRNNYE